MFDHLARTVCRAECLPKKELYEAWETARRVRRFYRGGRVIDLAAGHGLVAYVMLLLDDTSPSAIAVDKKAPPSAAKLAQVMVEEWPRLANRVSFVEASIKTELPFALTADDLLVSAHACGELTDHVLSLAIGARARVAVLPCCQAIAKQDLGGLAGWVEGELAIDLARANRLVNAGYTIRTQKIPAEISPKNRLLLGEPSSREPRA